MKCKVLLILLIIFLVIVVVLLWQLVCNVEGDDLINLELVFIGKFVLKFCFELLDNLG